MDIKLDIYNLVNIDDKQYYDRCYNLGFMVSNAINPCFTVYASDEMQAIEILLDKLIQENQENMFFENEIDIEFEDDYLYLDGGYYLNMGYFNIQEC